MSSAQKARLPREIAQARLRARADMLDRLGGGQSSETGAIDSPQLVCETGKKAGSEKIAGPGRIDELRDRMRRDRLGGIACDHERAQVVARNSAGDDRETGHRATYTRDRKASPCPSDR